MDAKKHRTLAEIIPQVVYGGVDGTISTFAVVAGAFGGGLKPSVIFILGVASLVADAFSMAVSAYLSAQSARRREPLRVGVVTFFAFVILGSLLLIPYLLGIFVVISKVIMFMISVVIAVGCFGFIGALKSHTEDTTKVRGALEVAGLGSVAACIALGLGYGLNQIIN